MAAEAKAAWDAHVDTRTGKPLPKAAEPSELTKLRNALGHPFKKMAGVIGAAAAPVPDTGDGSKIAPEDDPTILKKIADGLGDLSYLGVDNVKTLLEIQKDKMMGGYTDDKTYLMEGLIRTAAALPDNSKMRDELTNTFVTQLWNDLEHPPQSYLGAKYQYRTADGSNNSLIHPQLGAAGTPYARTVKPSMMQTPARPDAGVVFDSIMTRKHAELHPNRISSMLFYIASIIIHDCFRTEHTEDGLDSNSLTSSYLDLAPLYGSNQKEQDAIRTMKDGRIHPDCFSENRLLFFPPGVGAILIMFNRFHNHVVENLATINELGRFTKPSAEPPKPTGKQEDDEKAMAKWKAAWVRHDNDLFQTGRLITCGLYVNIILIDYVRTILDLNRTDSNWQLNPRAEVKDLPLGVGNQVSAEFNLVYRWHSTVSDRDEKWTQELMKKMWPNKDYRKLTKDEFMEGLHDVYKKDYKSNPAERNFANLKRNADGTLSDDDLAEILTSSIEDCANSFGPNRVPEVFRVIEMMGIEQARKWNLGSLNEFRKYFHLEPHRTFEDITSDKYVQQQLKHLYDHPDKIEIYPGIVVEDAKNAMAPGSGLCPPYTVSRAVLSDAVALVRGDRFYTHDYNPRTLTNWGYSLVQYDTGIDNGCVFYKLFLDALPNHFTNNSVYVHYPLTIPSAMEESLKDLGKAKLYDFSKPKKSSHPQLVKEYKVATEIMKDQETFKVTWGEAMEYIMGNASKDFMLAGDGKKNAESRAMVSKALYVPDWEKEIRSYYTAKTRELLAEKSAKIANFNQVDIIRDVGNLAHVHFCAELFMLPLKTEERPHGIFTEAELYMIMSGVFALIFFDVNPAGSFPLHIKAHKATEILGNVVTKNVEAIAHSGILSKITQAIWPNDSALKSYGIHFIERLLKSGIEPEKLVYGHMLGTAGGMVSNQGQLFGQTIEYYLLGAGKKHWADIQKLAQDDSDASFQSLQRYFLEGSRLAGETAVVRAAAKDTTVTDSGRTLNIKAGEKVFINLRAASHDPAIFPNPDEVDLNRPMDSYIHLGYGPHQCLGLPMAKITLTCMLKEVARLKNLRPAAGEQGKLHKVEKEMYPGEKYPYHAYLTENWDMYFPFPCGKLASFAAHDWIKANRPTALKVCWDD
jgi:hypothetical protein